MSFGPRPVLVIGGPTASGKSGLAVALAERLSGVVINADSMQVYEGLPILTAQPTPEERRDIPHRLYAVLAPEDACSAARWRDMALAEIEAAHAAGKVPVIVGGTGFYIKALLEGLSPIPDIPPGLRETIAARQKEMGHPRFHAELAKRDPETAAKLDPFNTQRLIRAVEVLEATGRGLAAWQAQARLLPPGHLRFFTAVLLPPRDVLYAACDKRFERMLAQGALAEVDRFRERGLPVTALAKALGYPELLSHLEGRKSLGEAVSLAQQATRHYAKRQVTWFSRQTRADLVLSSPDAEAVLRAESFIS